jgi:hypothetical protein
MLGGRATRGVLTPVDRAAPLLLLAAQQVPDAPEEGLHVLDHD